MKKKLLKSFYLILALLIIALCVFSCEKPTLNENETDASQNEIINGSSEAGSQGNQNSNESQLPNGEAEDIGELDDGISDDSVADIF